jgi:hypothetical protein
LIKQRTKGDQKLTQLNKDWVSADELGGRIWGVILIE